MPIALIKRNLSSVMLQTPDNLVREGWAVTSPQIIRKFVIIAMGLAVAYAVFVGTFRPNLPSLYYDELLFLPPVFSALRECGSFAPISLYLGDCWPILLSPFYLGALKTYLYVPIVALFPVSAEVVRLPAVILSIALALLSYRFFKPRIGPIFAAAAAVLLLTSPIYLWHAKVDWGPFVISATCRFFVLAFIIRWLEEGRPSDFTGAGLVFIAGVFDKLNFVWLLPPIAVSVWLIYPRETLLAVRSHWRRLLIVTVVFLSMGLIFLFYSIIPAIQLQIYPRPPSLMANVSRVIGLMDVTFSGEAQFSYMFTTPFLDHSNLGDIFFGQVVLGSLLAVAACLFRRRLAIVPERWAAAKLFVFVHFVLLSSIGILLVSADATGSHHAVFLLPFLAYDAALALKTLYALGQISKPMTRKTAAVAVVAVALLTTVENVRVGAAYLKALRWDDRAYQPNFTPTIYKLASTVDSLPGKHIFSVDWGIHMQLVSLASPGRRDRYRDYWPLFNDMPTIVGATNPLLGLVGAGTNAVFVAKSRKLATFPNAVTNFEAAISALPDCAVIQRREKDVDISMFTIVIVENNCR